MSLTLILGDSTSTTIGTGNKSYPFLLSQKKIWPKDSTIINCSLPGLTAADLCAIFFKDFFYKLKDISNVIIYIGNCDSASSELKKGKYTKFLEKKQKLSRRFGVDVKKTSLRNKLLYYEWNTEIDLSLESPESPDSYSFNIERILKACINSSTNLILVKPKANEKFPAGLGKGNFVFYHYFDLNDKSSSILQMHDKRFLNAYRLFEEKKYDESSLVYKEILTDFDFDKYGHEYPQVLVNNYAISRANLNQIEEAIFLLEMLLKEKRVRNEIIHYNLAKIYLKIGNATLYQFHIEKSYNLDTSMYRIRKPYLNSLDYLVNKYPNINVIDLHELCSNDLFLDHCHLLPQGHIIITEEINKKLCFNEKVNNSSATLENNLYNPEISKGNISDFFEYFKTFPNIDQNLIKKNVRNLNALLSSTSSDNLSSIQLKSFCREFREAFKYYRKHPIFFNDQQIFKTPPLWPSDIGRFPEFFLIRIIIPYMIKYEKLSSQKKLFSSSFTGLKSSEELLNLLPEKCRTIDFECQFWLSERATKMNFECLLDSIENHLNDNITRGNIIYTRKKSTIFWYVREALRFGGHSRISMLYDFLNLQFISEAIMVAYIGNINSNFGFDNKIKKLASFTEQVIKTHHSFCSKYLDNPNSFDHEIYHHKIIEMKTLLLKVGKHS